MANRNLTVFETTNNELRNVPDAFKARGKGVVSVEWQVELGTIITQKLQLGLIHWQDGTNDSILAPNASTGNIISALNQNIDTASLKYPPSVYLMRCRGKA